MTTLAESSELWPAGSPDVPTIAETTATEAFAQPALSPLSAAQKLLLPLGVVLFNWLFWQEHCGLNMLVFALSVVAAQLVMLPRHAAVRRSAYFWQAVGGSLFGGAMVAVYGSAVAALACTASLLVLLGYVNQPHLKLLVYAVLTAVHSLALAALQVVHRFRTLRNNRAGIRRSWFYGRLFLVPLGVLAAFHGLFAVANPVYDELSGQVLAVLGHWLAQLLPDLSFGHCLFFALAFLVTAGVVVVVPVHLFADHESRFGEFIRRQRDRVASLAVRRPDFRFNSARALDLRKEFIAAVAVFGLVNVLLLVVNAIDVHWLWFGFVPTPGFDLAQFVHEGTYVLIFSILLAMGIVLWFFRRNLNFYEPGLPWLRWGATAWVLQNAVLAASVGLRNYYYILHCGVAYKRIGVCFFLLLTFFGLATVLLKIWQRRSAYGLVRLNSLAAYAVLLSLAAGNWEVWIVRYNLQPQIKGVDIGFMLDMHGRAMPALLARRAVINQLHLTTENEDGHATEITSAEAQQRLDIAAATWKTYYATHSDWQELTYSDWMAYRQLEASQKP